MRGFLVVTIVGSLGLVACRPGAYVTRDPSGVPVVSARSSGRFDDVRSTLEQIAASRDVVRLAPDASATGDAEPIELSALDNDDLDMLVVVRVTVDRTFIGGDAVANGQDAALVAAKSFDGKRFALIRSTDDARIDDVVRVAKAVRSAGFDHTILSTRDPNHRRAVRTRGDDAPVVTCPWPLRGPRSPVAAAKAMVRIVRDGTTGVGVVRVVNAPPGGFRQAAAFCASAADVSEARSERELDLVVEFEVGNRLPCDTPGDDQMARGAYTANEMNARYGTLPSAGCDRFPR